MAKKTKLSPPKPKTKPSVSVKGKAVSATKYCGSKRAK